MLAMSTPRDHRHASFLALLDSLPTRWQHHKAISPLPHRLAMRALEILALAAAIFITPTGIQRIVQSLDDVYELLGRRARSPYDGATPWASVLFAMGLLAVWHVVLGKLSYGWDDGGRKGRGSWGRLLGRVIIPGLLLVFGVRFGMSLLGRVWWDEKEFVKGNVVDVRDVDGL